MNRVTSQLWLSPALLALLLLLAGCGGGAPATPAGPGSAAAPPTDTIAGQTPPGVSLPALDSLPQPAHQASALGPGWLPLAQSALVSSSGLTLEADEAISLHDATAYAYAVYCIYGFDGDNGPTSARVSSPGASGDFYVAFSDYQDGKWLFAGPYHFDAGGGTTEITIPNSGEFVSPHAFIGRYFNATYLALVVAQDAQLDAAAVALGVHGGRLGPRPAGGIFCAGNTTGATISWEASPDELAPDFAGYLIERAEIWEGAYVPVNAEPVEANQLPDPDAEMDHTYRYRVAAVDVNGNRSVWSEGFGLMNAQLHQPLVVVVDGVPDTPVYGPVTLDLHMEDSYDPEGDPIDTYIIKDWNDTIYSSAAFSVMQTFQPGCHKLVFIVKSGGKQGFLVKYLKVLPQWQDSAYMVSAPQTQNAFPRVEGLALKRTADGVLHQIAYDRFIPGFIDRRFRIGKSSALYTAPAYNDPQFMCEPQVVGNRVYFGYSFAEGWHVYASDAAGVKEIRGNFFTNTQLNPQFALVSDGADQLWIILAQDNGVFQLDIMSMVFASTSHIVDPLPSLLDLDAVYDPALDVIWVVYSTNASTEWIKVDPATLGVLDNGTLAGFASPKVDIEYDPIHSMPVAAYNSLGNIYYTYFDGIWHLGELVDPSGGNGSAFDLDVAGGIPHVALAEVGGQASVYTRTAINTWEHIDVAYSANSGMQLGLAAWVAGGNQFAVADVTTSRHVYCNWIKVDATQQVFFDQWPTTGQGIQMHGAGGADGLHVICDQMLGPAMHFTGSADGKSWLGAAMPVGPQNLDLCALADGTVYASWNSAATATLQRWDAPAWTQIAAVPSATTARPFMAHGAPSTVVSWAGYDDATNHLHAYKGNQADGYDTADALFKGLYAYSGIGIIDSETALPEYSTNWYILHCNPIFNYEESSLGAFSSLDYDNNTLIYHSLNINALHDKYVFGRNVAAAEYYVADNTLAYQAVWLSNGVAEAAWRYTPNFQRVNEYTDLPANLDAPGFDARRTVSAATTPHDLTAVGLVCDLSGNDQYLEWSNYGQWERLPLPPEDKGYASDRHMNQPQLFIGMDGRWHLVYRDYDTDTIFCRSTL